MTARRTCEGRRGEIGQAGFDPLERGGEVRRRRRLGDRQLHRPDAADSLFPFLIFVAALAGFLGSAELAKEAAGLVFAEWPSVAGPIAGEVANVLTAPRGRAPDARRGSSFYFASSAIEALRVGLNRAYGLSESRPWWLLRLQSLGLVFVGSVALLALAFLVVLGPLILDAVAALCRGWQRRTSF